MTEEERRAMIRNNYAAQMEMLGYQTDGNPKDMVEVVRCRECILRGTYDCPIYVGGDGDHGSPDDWFCADGRSEEGESQ